MDVSGGTRVFAILGDPVAHSLSPVMQNAAFHALGLPAIYVPLRCNATALGTLMESLAAQGGGGNVTIPHKAAAAAVISGQTAGEPPLAVCNTFWGCNGRLEGTETDSGAIIAALERLTAPGNTWLVIGTGGSAHAALLAAKRGGARIAVRSRSGERAKSFEHLAEALGVPLARDAEYDVVLNCTPLGLQDGDPLPLDPALVPEPAVALDLVYRRGETAWVRALRALGRRAADGREVLLEQGAAAFEHWFPGRRAPREVMRAAVRAALE
ncbi:MAG TPA: shikimate dehydrogenase [Gemmatimonadales bacterium]|jgi:shikimate dehydrogenase|nr:shikimate dehydrogenase [Gemmatimonadales bacterium]